MNRLRKTRIVATLGPAVDNLEMVEDLIKAGVNIARLNFSHGNHAEQKIRMDMVKQASKETGIPAAIMLDTKGPEIRTGKIKDGGTITLTQGAEIIMTTEQVEGDEHRISVSYEALPREVKPGGHIFIADGLLDIRVVGIEDTEIHCIVENGGLLGSRKNVNVPGVRTSLPAITEKDRDDILFGVEQGIDFIAASFIRKPEDIVTIQELLATVNASHVQIVAKIEDQEGLDNIDEIIRVSNGIMIARGDLGVQLETEQIPLAQKRIISKCNRLNKPVITATQMLDSMIYNPNPTRAELTDVANAIFDGTDAVMLSGETASGKYPLRSVETLNRIALEVENSQEYHERCAEYFTFHRATSDIGHSAAKAAYLTATDIDAAAIVTPTLHGNSPRILSKYRPRQNIVAVTTSAVVQRQLLLNWGIFPILSDFVRDSEVMIQNALRLALKYKYIQKLDKVVTAAGIPVHSPLMLNTIKVHFMGNIIARGNQGAGDRASGKIIKAEHPYEAASKLGFGERQILVTRTWQENLRQLLPRLNALVIEEPVPADLDILTNDIKGLVAIADIGGVYDTLEESQFV
ncbi:MAG: pyruvate kinase, partial [Spirochaeta sp.]|nr:pyruvate kinase [Spirochaeta sp.]